VLLVSANPVAASAIAVAPCTAFLLMISFTLLKDCGWRIVKLLALMLEKPPVAALYLFCIIPVIGHATSFARLFKH
jgi:hypothetical protein